MAKETPKATTVPPPKSTPGSANETPAPAPVEAKASKPVESKPASPPSSPSAAQAPKEVKAGGSEGKGPEAAKETAPVIEPGDRPNANSNEMVTEGSINPEAQIVTGPPVEFDPDDARKLTEDPEDPTRSISVPFSEDTSAPPIQQDDVELEERKRTSTEKRGNSALRKAREARAARPIATEVPEPLQGSFNDSPKAHWPRDPEQVS